jgi:VPDSG-CTERM motif
MKRCFIAIATGLSLAVSATVNANIETLPITGTVTDVQPQPVPGIVEPGDRLFGQVQFDSSTGEVLGGGLGVGTLLAHFFPGTGTTINIVNEGNGQIGYFITIGPTPGEDFDLGSGFLHFDPLHNDKEFVLNWVGFDETIVTTGRVDTVPDIGSTLSLLIISLGVIAMVRFNAARDGN